MKVEIRPGAKRRGIESTEVAYVVFKPNFLEGFFIDRYTRKALHRWGQGWRWEDTNKPCPGWVEQELNKEVNNVH